MKLSTSTKQFSAVLNTRDQSIKQLSELLAKVGGLAGCEGCGRMAYIDIHFHDDPIVDMRDLGVLSHGQLGF